MSKFIVMSIAFSAAVAMTATAGVVVERCWAMTKSGNRCQRRAVAHERYCRQHAASRRPPKAPDICRSMTTNGVRCCQAPLPNCNYCKDHLK